MKRDNLAIPDVVDFAHQIIDMHRLIQRQANELEEAREYQKKYFALIQSDIEHGRHMIGGILQIAMTPGVMDAIDKHNKEKVTE